MAASTDIPEDFPEKAPAASSMQPDLLVDKQVINRRHFLKATAGVSLGIAAVSSYSKESKKEQLIADAQAPFFYEGKDENGIEHYEHPSGIQKVSILYTNHNEAVNPALFPDDATDFSYDNGGRGRALGCEHKGYFFSSDASPHYKEMGEHIIENGYQLHLLCPAAPFANNEDTAIPQGIDYGITATQSGIGALLLRDAFCELSVEIKHRVETLRRDCGNDIMMWDVLKGSAGVMLFEPFFAAISRLQKNDKLDEGSKAWLQSSFSRNPQLLPFMNMYIDVLHAIKLRQLMADKVAINPQKKQHFHLVIGKTHVGVESHLQRSMDDLLAELENPIMQTMFQVTSPLNSLSIPTSIQSRFSKKPNSFNKKGWELHEERQEIFYPEIFKRLPNTPREDLVRAYPPHYFLDHRFIGTAEGGPANINLLAGKQ